jgi:hypothetical protein
MTKEELENWLKSCYTRVAANDPYKRLSWEDYLAKLYELAKQDAEVLHKRLSQEK